MHIPKTAGTSIEDAAISIGIKWGRFMFKNNIKSYNKYLFKDIMDIYSYAPWHIPLPLMIEYFNITNPSNIPKEFDLTKVDYFTVIRNPFTKLLSEYRYILSNIAAQKNVKSIFNEWEINENGNCSIKLLNYWMHKFLIYHRNYTVNKCWMGCHFMPQWRFIYDENGEKIVEHVIRFENLYNEFDDIKGKYYGLYENITIKGYYQNTHNHCINMSIVDFDAKVVDLIQQIYRLDFLALRYDPNPS